MCSGFIIRAGILGRVKEKEKESRIDKLNWRQECSERKKNVLKRMSEILEV